MSELEQDTIEVLGYLIPAGTSCESIAKLIEAESDRIAAQAELVAAEASLVTAHLELARFNHHPGAVPS